MTAESRGDCSGLFLFVPGRGGDQAAQGRGFSVWRLRRPEMEAGWWRVGGSGVAEKQGVSLPRGIGHIPRIPLPHFWTGVGEKGAGGFACPQRENYKRLSTDFTNSDRYAKIRNEGMHTLTEPFPTFAAGSRPVSAFVGTASQTSDTFGEGTGVGPANLAPDVIGPSQTREPV